jgi:hypothetical protein
MPSKIVFVMGCSLVCVSLPTARPTDAGASFGTGGAGPTSTGHFDELSTALDKLDPLK